MADDPSAGDLRSALAEAQSLLERPGVAGVGEGATDEGVACVIVMTAGVVDLEALPREIAGVQVRVVDIGEELTAFDHEAVDGVEVSEVEPDCG